MNRKFFSGLMAAAMAVSALVLPASAERGGLLISPRPPVIAPNPVIAPAPQESMTRGAVISALWELSGKPVVNYAMDFADVAQGSQEAEAIRWAASEGIAAGYGNGCFGAADGVTREQLSTILYHYVQKFGMGFRDCWMIRLTYGDLADISQWAYEPVCWLVVSGLLDGGAAELKPGEKVSPEEGNRLLAGIRAEAEKAGVDFGAYGQ